MTQADSKVLKGDSNAMKSIAIMGLLFLPFEAVVVSWEDRCTMRTTTKLLTDTFQHAFLLL